MTRRILPSIALAAATIIISLFIGEAVFRWLGHKPREITLNPNFWITGWAPMDPYLGWVNREGAFRSVEPGNALMRFEADGRRHDPLGPKGADVPKILVVGCSFTQGEGVPDDDPYPHVINRAMPAFEVLNYGTGGYGTYQSLLRMKTYFGSPHAATPVVIYGFNGHHITRNVATADWVTLLTTRDGRYLVPPHVRLSGEGLRELPASPVRIWPLETQSALVSVGHNAMLKTMQFVRWRDRLEIMRRLLREMKQTAAANNAWLLVLRQVGTEPALEIMQQEGIDSVFCEPPDPFDPEYRVGGVGHPNGKQHARWARCVLEALAKRGYPVSAMAESRR
jgi:hypothetical protein